MIDKLCPQSDLIDKPRILLVCEVQTKLPNLGIKKSQSRKPAGGRNTGEIELDSVPETDESLTTDSSRVTNPEKNKTGAFIRQ